MGGGWNRDHFRRWISDCESSGPRDSVDFSESPFVEERSLEFECN